LIKLAFVLKISKLKHWWYVHFVDIDGIVDHHCLNFLVAPTNKYIGILLKILFW
jgi:hypothetical protein